MHHLSKKIINRLFLLSDTNECKVNNGHCQHQCINDVGSYHCACKSGYELSVDKHSCDGEYRASACLITSVTL